MRLPKVVCFSAGVFGGGVGLETSFGGLIGLRVSQCMLYEESFVGDQLITRGNAALGRERGCVVRGNLFG